MATNQILSKFGTPAAMTCTLGGLASSTGGLTAKQTTLVDNSTTKFPRVFVHVKIKLGTSPTSNRAVYVFLLRGDATRRTDGAGPSDAALTVKNAVCLGTLSTGSAAGTGDVLQDFFVIDNPGPEWGLAIGHDSAVNLDATDGNHTLFWFGENPDVQAAA